MNYCLICCILILVVLVYIYRSAYRRPLKRWKDSLLVVAIVCQLWSVKKAWEMQ